MCYSLTFYRDISKRLCVSLSSYISFHRLFHVICFSCWPSLFSHITFFHSLCLIHSAVFSFFFLFSLGISAFGGAIHCIDIIRVIYLAVIYHFAPVHILGCFRLWRCCSVFYVLHFRNAFLYFSFFSCSVAVLGRGPDEEEEEQVEDGPGSWKLTSCGREGGKKRETKVKVRLLEAG